MYLKRKNKTMTNSDSSPEKPRSVSTPADTEKKNAKAAEKLQSVSKQSSLPEPRIQNAPSIVKKDDAGRIFSQIENDRFVSE